MFKTFKSSKLYKYIFVLILIIGTFFATAESSWNLNNGKVGIDNIFSAEYVCFNKNTDTKYYRVEDALDKAKSGETIYCYPGKDPIIRRDCTISNNVTLVLPYEGETWDGRKSGENFPTGNSIADFADSNSNNVSTYKKNELTLASNVTLSIEGGKLFVGGVLGNETPFLSGHTSGNYTQITMESNSKIIAKKGYKNEIQCLGYIKEKYTGSNITNNSEVILESGTTLKLPFVIYDYRGGSDTVGSYKKGGISPFAIFDFPNIQVKSTINYGTSVIGFADLYTSTIIIKHNTTNINVVGNSGSLVNLKENSYVVYKYNHSDLRYTTKDTSSYSNIDFYGGMTAGNLKMDITVAGITQSISTEKVLFPLSYRLNLSFYNGVYDLNVKYKMMTGSKFYSDYSSTVNFNNDFIIYNSYSDPDGGGAAYPTKERAKFIINGNTNINAAFGGLVETTSDKELIYLNISSKTLTVTSTEGHGSSNIVTNKFNKYTDQPDLTQTARGEVLNADKTSHPVTNFESTIYTSNKYSYFVKADDLGSYTIKYFNEDKTLYKEVNYPIFKGESITLSGLSIEEPIKRFYKFDGWKITNNSDLTSNLVDPNGFIVSANNVYYAIATYSLATYNVSYNYQFIGCDEVDVINPNATLLSFTYDDLGSIGELKKAYAEGLYFDGWYVNNDFNNTYLTLDESISDVGYKDIVLTSKFTNSKPYTIKFIDSGNEQYYTEGDLNTQKVTKGSDIKIPSPINCNDNPDFPKYLEAFYDQYGNKLDNNYVLNGQDDVITFTAKWLNKDVLTYLDNNDNVISKQYFIKGSNAKLKGFNDFSDTTNYTDVPIDETDGADYHTYGTLDGFTTTKGGNKLYNLEGTITNFNSMNLYPYYNNYKKYKLYVHNNCAPWFHDAIIVITIQETGEEIPIGEDKIITSYYKENLNFKISFIDVEGDYSSKKYYLTIKKNNIIIENRLRISGTVTYDKILSIDGSYNIVLSA